MRPRHRGFWRKQRGVLVLSGHNNILGASLSTTGTFALLTPFTPPTLPSSAGSDMLVVSKKFLYLPQTIH